MVNPMNLNLDLHKKEYRLRLLMNFDSSQKKVKFKNHLKIKLQLKMVAALLSSVIHQMIIIKIVNHLFGASNLRIKKYLIDLPINMPINPVSK